LTPGQIVEYIEEGRVVVTVCLEERKGRIRVLTEKQREVHLASSRIVHASETRLALNQTREALARRLQELSVRREELANQIDMVGLWEVLHEEEAEYTARELAELAFEKDIGDDHYSAVIRAMLADRLYFRFRVHGFRPNDPETVQKIFTQRAREEERERQVDQGSQWIRSLWEGKGGAPPEGSQEIVDLLKDYAALGKGAQQAGRTEEILRRAGMTHPLAAFRVLVRLEAWSPDENVLIHRFGTRTDFPSRVEGEAAATLGRGFPLEEDSARENLTDLPIFTIDSPQTKDIDDALSLEILPDGCRVGIHITDVSMVVQSGSALDGEAALRGTSLYLPDQRIPMLPSAISEDLCSLKVGEIRPAVSFILDVDSNGTVQSHRFCPAWIRVRDRLSYEDADRAAEDSSSPMAALYRIARAWREDRVQRGALLLPLPEISVRLDESGSILVERRDRENPSQILVSEMMIRANWLVAQWLGERGIPCIYRTQPDPRERILEGSVSDLYLNYRQRKLMNRAEIQLIPGPHSGLGLEPYTTVTSPIRRYQDLVVQRQLSAALRGTQVPYSREALERIVAESEELLAQASQLEQTRQRYWLLKHLENRKGEETPALVVGRYGRRVQVLLTEYMLETSLPLAAAGWLQEGQEIMARIVRAKPLEDELRVELV
jgi:exoribonuclease II